MLPSIIFTHDFFSEISTILMFYLYRNYLRKMVIIFMGISSAVTVNYSKKNERVIVLFIFMKKRDIE